MKRLTYLLFLLIFSSPSLANEKTQLIVKYRDGSSIVATTSEQFLEIETKYGKQKIPFVELLSVEVGLHFSNQTDKEIKESITNLNSTNYDDREKAVAKLIKLGTYSYLPIKNLQSQDLEVVKRIEQMLEKIAINYPDRIQTEKDLVVTEEFTLKGRITSGIFITNENLGKLKTEWYQISNILIKRTLEKTYEIDASKFQNTWLDSGLKLNSKMKYLIKAKGEIDMWPLTPGQHMMGPDGGNGNGQNEQLPAGALIYRVKNNNFYSTSFIVGTSCGIENTEGHLEFRIVKGPWGGQCQGKYNIFIKTY